MAVLGELAFPLKFMQQQRIMSFTVLACMPMVLAQDMGWFTVIATGRPLVYFPSSYSIRMNF